MRERFSSRRILSWCLYDFANSSYSAVIAAVVFPVYYTKVIVGNEAGLGDLWWGRAISLSMAIVALSSPFLGGAADRRGGRKALLVSYTLFSVSAVAGFSLLGPGMAAAGFFLIVAANVGMEGGLVFYNAYLTDVASPGQVGRVSAWGFGLGYAGSAVSLLLALPLVRSGHYGAVWIMVAAFFLLFSFPLFSLDLRVKQEKRPKSESFFAGARDGLRETVREFRVVWASRDVRRFLTAFFLYQDGVGTVIVFSSIFAATTLGFAASELVFLYMAVQVTALAGSFAMARKIDSWGPKRVILLSLALWVTVTVSAYFVTTKPLFWLISALAGLGLGTIQAASRALFANLVPQGREAGYFGIYALVGKTSAILGPLVFGSVSSAFGSQRPAILAVTTFFLVGGVIMSGVADKR